MGIGTTSGGKPAAMITTMAMTGPGQSKARMLWRRLCYYDGPRKASCETNTKTSLTAFQMEVIGLECSRALAKREMFQ